MTFLRTVAGQPKSSRVGSGRDRREQLSSHYRAVRVDDRTVNSPETRLVQPASLRRPSSKCLDPCSKEAALNGDWRQARRELVLWRNHCLCQASPLLNLPLRNVHNREFVAQLQIDISGKNEADNASCVSVYQH